MEFWDVLQNRHSCREFEPGRKIASELINQVLEAGNLAPSPANRQPWEFVVLKNQELKNRLWEHAAEMVQELHQRSGWGWLGKYRVDFLKEAPVLIGVVGDPARSGADIWVEGRGEGYAHACAAVIENMLLAATALELGSLWFSLFDKKPVQELLGVEPEKDLIAFVCLGYPASPQPSTPRKPLETKVRVIE